MTRQSVGCILLFLNLISSVWAHVPQATTMLRNVSGADGLVCTSNNVPKLPSNQYGIPGMSSSFGDCEFVKTCSNAFAYATPLILIHAHAHCNNYPFVRQLKSYDGEWHLLTYTHVKVMDDAEAEGPYRSQAVRAGVYVFACVCV